MTLDQVLRALVEQSAWPSAENKREALEALDRYRLAPQDRLAFPPAPPPVPPLTGG